MGCGSSKVKPNSSGGGKDTQSGRGSTPLRTAELKEVEESQSFGSTRSRSNKSGQSNGINTGSADIPGNVPEPIAFEIPALDDEESIVKKHPPKRLQRLEDQQVNITHDQLVDKQKEVEDRRQQILIERVQSSRRSAHHRRLRMTTNDITGQITEGHVETSENKTDDITDL